MRKDSSDRSFMTRGYAGGLRDTPAGSQGQEVYSNPLGLRGFLFVGMVLAILFLALGCQKKEKASPVPPAVESKALEGASAPGAEQKIPEPGAQALTFHSILTKDLNRPIPSATFSKNDRIYLVTTWTGLHGPHEIKVLWVRPDKTVQETVRLKENISSKIQTYSSWAYLSFTKGLLNISPVEGKFIGVWKAQLFLDEKLLKEYDFSVL